MERLPQEVVAKIAGYLPDRHEGKRIRPALATLSRSWQSAIEPFTFKSLHITSDDLKKFYPAFAGCWTRRRFLRDLHLDIVLPRYSDEDCAKYETADDRAANNEVLSHHTSALLQELSQWPAGGKLNLVIGLYSPMDDAHRGPEKFDHDHHEVALGRRQDIFSERYRYSYIRFIDTSLAVVPCVTSLYAHTGPRYLDPGSLVALTAAFPNLERINWPYEDPAYFLALRRQQIQEFASAVADFQPPSTCKTLFININSPWYPHKERLPDLNSGDDSFCGALCAMLSRSNIQRLDYEGPIDPTLFWPQESHKTDDTSSWKSLHEIEVRFGLGSLAGQWFFKGLNDDRFYDQSSDVPLPQDAAGLLPPGYYDSDEENEEAIALVKAMEMPNDEDGFVVEGCEFRCFPRDEAIIPLLTAVARRLSHTPSLRTVYLETTLPRDKGVWFFSFHMPGEMSDWDEYVDCEGSACDDPCLAHVCFCTLKTGGRMKG
ncbi:uncharacterized protein ColSpa_08806 [Colletotrichum spaethianum]|uniref:F-box domain-containing protein n=1 Tax=Colletotrichum spaethianum TaxID=700344 RepID=A0AA37PAI8_9PEZI|nr:uncharacterized protein ColSpa_08806 [Colletotrichum spaethianum]GKT48625.1 hypothetical protein ColSpa_08806 [Colletotrichum spaethianum]